MQVYPSQPGWPGGYDGCRLRGTYYGSDGAPIAGSIEFTMDTPSVHYLARSADGNKRVIVPRLIRAVLVEGVLDVTLPSTDSPYIVPQNWTWTATETWDSGEVWSFRAPANVTLEVDDVRRIDPSGGAVPYRVTASVDLYDGGFL